MKIDMLKERIAETAMMIPLLLAAVVFWTTSSIEQQHPNQ